MTVTGRLALLLALLSVPAHADEEEERRAFLELQAKQAQSDPAAVAEAAAAFRKAYPESGLLPSVVLAEIPARRALLQTVKVDGLRLMLMVERPDTAATRGVLASYRRSDDCADAISDVIRGYLSSGDPRRLANLRVLYRVVLAARPGVAAKAQFAFPGLALFPDDSGTRAELLRRVRRLSDDYKPIRDALEAAPKRPLEAVLALQSHSGKSPHLARRCAALLMSRVVTDSPRARLARARADLQFRGTTPTAPLLADPIVSGEQAYVIAVALMKAGKNEKAREFLAKHQDGLPADEWTVALFPFMRLELGIDAATARLENSLLAAFRHLLAGGDRWAITLRTRGGETDLDARGVFDFSAAEWRARAELDGTPIILVQSKLDTFRMALTDKKQIFEFKGGGYLAAFLLQLEPLYGNRFTLRFYAVLGTDWRDTGRLNQHHRQNPMIASMPGLRQVLAKILRPWIPAGIEQDGEDFVHSWLEPNLYKPAFDRTEFRFDSGGRLVALRLLDAEGFERTISVRCGGKADIPDLPLDWPDRQVAVGDRLDAPRLWKLFGKVFEKGGWH